MIRKLLGAAFILLAASPAPAKWREASSDHFVIYSEEGEADLKRFAEQLERFDAAMRYLAEIQPWKPSPSNRLTIYVVPTISSVRKLTSERRAAGFYVPRVGGSIAVVPRLADVGGRGIGAQTVLLHEYAHHFMFQNYVSPVPAWFTEGYAEFYSTAKFEKNGAVGIGLPAQHRAYGLTFFDTLSLSEMMNYRAGVKLSATERENLYGRGWLLTHYLTFEPARSGQLANYIDAVGSGSQGVEAGTKAFGDLKTLDGDLDQYLRRRKLSYLLIGAEKLSPGSVSVRELRPGEDAVMTLRIRSDRGGSLEQARALVGDMRKAAAPHSDDPFAQTALAEAEYDARNYDEAEAAADRALAADPANSEALVYKGMIRMARARGSKDPAVWKDVRQWFVKANKLDSEDPEPLSLYYRTFQEQGITPPKVAVDGLIYAADLAREEPSLRLLAAREYLNQGKVKEARLLLATVAYNPHGGRSAEAASAILAALDAAGTQAALGSFKGPDADTAEDAEGDGEAGEP